MVNRMNLEDLKKQMFAAMKAGRVTEKEVLRTAIGEITQAAAGSGRDATEEDVERVLRKLLKSNHETLALTEGNGKKRLLQLENSVIEALLPETLSPDQIADALGPVVDAVRAAGGDGPATGIAMKHLKAMGLAVTGKDVAAAVRTLRA